jgi:1-pyrroline-4-hydroxy-2-carboxylate deaminase
MNANVFTGAIPALMTPCNPSRMPNFDVLVKKGKSLINAGMNAVVYCGSMGDWPLLTDAQRQEGVACLVEAGIPVIVGTGAQNSKSAAAHAAHAKAVGAHGLMVIPRVLSRGTSVAAQRAHFAQILAAGEGLPSVIYNSPYYGYETKADLFFDLRREFPNLIGFKEFGGAQALRYAAENITFRDDGLSLLVGVDTQVVHGVVNCGAVGAITGIGNVLPEQVLHLLKLSQAAATGDPKANRLAHELEKALMTLSTFDEGPDLVLYYKYMLFLRGDSDYALHFNETDELNAGQKRFAQFHLEQFDAWWEEWDGKAYPN